MHTSIVVTKALTLSLMLRAFVSPVEAARRLFGEGLVSLDDIGFQAERLEADCLRAIARPLLPSRPALKLVTELRDGEVHSEQREEEL